MDLRIKEVIKEKGMTITELADKMGINRVNLSNMVNGNPTVETLNKIIDYSNRLEIINPLVPVQFTIEEDCKYIGKTAGETKFWQNTGATIVAVKRGEELIISPGPYIEFLAGDLLLVVGDKHIYNSVPAFLYDNK